MATVSGQNSSPPYSGTENGYVSDTLSGCEISASTPVLPFFNLTTGHATESAKVAARSCGTANSSAFINLVATYTGRPFTPTAGVSHFKQNWVLDLVSKLMVTPGSGAPYALFSVDLSFQLADLTQGGTSSGGTVTLSNEIFSGSYSQGHTGLHRSTYYNVTLNATHSYQFVAQIQISVGVFAPPGSNSASAFVNMGSGGRNAFLASITGE
ncbi:MAG: hypothetical protein WA761_09010 [Thermoplasmata archaeon]